jgi:hypothetical protein
MGYVAAGYVVALVTLAAYGISLIWRVRRAERRKGGTER